MDLFSFSKTPQEAVYAPVKPMPWPVKASHVWLISGVLAPDCLSLTQDLIPGFAMRGYQLQSYPLLLGQLTTAGLRYNFPGQEPELSSLNEIEFRKAVVDALGLEMNSSAGYFIRQNPDMNSFFVAEILATDYRLFLQLANKYIGSLPLFDEKLDVRFSKRFRDTEDEDYLHDSATEQNSYGADPEIQKLAKDVESKIAALVMQDFPIEVIETWLQKAVKLSRIKITDDYRILLTDYNKEIKMRQLPKTLFLWMLKHPEGCRLKDLYMHEKELLGIYRKLTIHDDTAQTKSSIQALVNPLGNSFSEKCAAIKYAFLNEIPERLANYYYVHGPQGGTKAIDLDRALVDWGADI